MIKLNQLIIDANGTIGDKLLLTSIAPAFAYKNGLRTEEIEGYKYTVSSEKLGFEKISIKVLGKKLMEMGEEYEYVKFDDLSMSIYFRSGEPQISAKAMRITPLTHKSELKTT